MSAPTLTVPGPGATGAASIRQARISRSRRVRNRLASVLMVVSFLVALTPMVFLVYYVASKGLAQLSVSFLTEDIPRQYRAEGPGMGPAVVGTILTTGAASLLAIPTGVMGAVYLNEYGRNRPFARLLRTMSDVMTGVPSIVMGLFVYSVWVLRFEKQSAFAGALALASLMLPIVIRSTEEMLRLVPDELRQASTALGAHRWKTTVGVVLPAALPGIISGSLLAVARAAGETAPLIFTIGVTYSTDWDLFDSNTALSAQIFRNASQPFQGAIDRAWGAAITLVLLVFVLTIAARLVSARFATKVS